MGAFWEGCGLQSALPVSKIKDFGILERRPANPADPTDPADPAKVMAGVAVRTLPFMRRRLRMT